MRRSGREGSEGGEGEGEEVGRREREGARVSERGKHVKFCIFIIIEEMTCSQVNGSTFWLRICPFYYTWVNYL